MVTMLRSRSLILAAAVLGLGMLTLAIVVPRIEPPEHSADFAAQFASWTMAGAAWGVVAITAVLLRRLERHLTRVS